jgi:hypothetical protein
MRRCVCCNGFWTYSDLIAELLQLQPQQALLHVGGGSRRDACHQQRRDQVALHQAGE